MDHQDELDWKNLAIGFLRIAASYNAAQDSHYRIMRRLVTRDWEVKALSKALSEQLKMESFHRRRIMFFITDKDELLVADSHLTWSHKQWAVWMDQNWKHVQWSWVRGFYWPETNTIYFYIGDDCYIPSDHDQASFLRHREELLKKLGTVDPAIYMGMRPSQLGELGPPREVFAKGGNRVENRNDCQDSPDGSTAWC